MRAAAGLLALIAGCTGIVVPATARAEEGRFYGMLRERDLSPFGFLRLDMRPAHAVSIEPHSFAIEMELGYPNTWALVPGKFLTVGSPPAATTLPRRHRGHPQPASENYLVDLESATLTLGCTTVEPGRCTVCDWVSYRAASWIRASSSFTTPSAGSFGRPAGRNQANIILI
jgi:hypothetical protein